MMTRKDYIRAAQTLYAYDTDTTAERCCVEPHRLWVRAAFITLFTDDNPRFDRKRFIAACEVSSHETP